MLTRLLVAILFVLAAAPAYAQEAKEPAKDKPKETAEQKAIRAHLKENLPTGKFEEIKWWDPTTLKSSDWQGWVAVRLKFRAENQVGGMSVHDDIFMIRTRDKFVDWQKPGSPINGNKERIFGK